MEKTLYRVYKNGEFMEGSTWRSKEVAMDTMKIEMECEISELQHNRPISQFVMTIDEEKMEGTIDEYYYDENYEEDCWNFDVSKYEVKEYVWTYEIAP